MESMKEEVSFRHFSHHHPLILTTAMSSPARNIACSGCKLSIMPGKDCYHCKICNFSLHKVCYGMPRKTRHPGHPKHLLNLLVMPSSSSRDNIIKCDACGQNIITGFYYNCGQYCGFCCHILCSALPLSISITNSHSHSLTLEFSPPYDFKCDLCYEPCYGGWLYRCRLCEFDAHLGCATVNYHKTRSSTASTMELPSNNELMQLVSQGIVRGVAVSGWDEKLCSPREKLNLRNNGVIEFSGTIQTKQKTAAAIISPVPGGNSEQHSTVSSSSSYQFSDSYFSIDLAKSYSSIIYDDTSNSGGTCDSNNVVFQDVEGKIIRNKNNFVLDRIAENSEPAAAKQELWKPSFGFHYYGTEYKINEAFLNDGGGGNNDTSEKQSKQKMKNKDTSSSIKIQRSISDPELARGSCWWKLLHYCCCCCYHSKYERETIFPQA